MSWLESKVVTAYAEVVKQKKGQLLNAILDVLDMDDDSLESLQELDALLTDYVILDLAYLKLIRINTGEE